MSEILNEITIEGLNKDYEGQVLFNNLNCRFKYGEIYCIMGESGIGKTTLLNIMMGLIFPDNSEAVVAGVGRASAVFQENRLIEDMTAIDNVKLVLKGVPVAVIRQELEKLLPKECLLQKVSELSGGMKRRVAIVRAMMSESDVVFMDEPFTGLDEDSKIIVCEYIKDRQHNRTIIVVTHNKDDAKALGAKIYLLTSQGAVATIRNDCE